MTKRAVIITTTILVAIMMIVTILFGAVFRVRKIELVYGQDFVYKSQDNEILGVSKLNKNISIFEVDRDKIALNIEKIYHYAKAQVNLSSLTSVTIKLSNRTPMYYFVQDNVYYILDEDCKILEVETTPNNAISNIKLTNVFSASEDTVAGEFLSNKYSGVCTSLYKAMYSNAVLNIGEDSDLDGELDLKHFNREDMKNIITDIAFDSVYDLNGKLDKLVMSTSYGVKLTIVQPQVNLDYKVNMLFSALRKLIADDNINSTNLSNNGAINVVYDYDEFNNQKTICEYKAN